MAYRFNGSTDWVEFAKTPLGTSTFGPVTMAILFKRNAIGSPRTGTFGVTSSTITTNIYTLRTTTADLAQLTGTTAATGPAMGSTTPWYLLALTRATGASVTPRFHLWNGSSWAHSDSTAGATGAVTIGASDRLQVGRSGSEFLNADVACVGIKLADSADATVETLSITAFSAWVSFGFEWLIGFDSSLEAGGVLQDQGTVGTGDEIGITGTSAVSDPPGWSWSLTPPSTFVPRVSAVY